MKSPVSVLIALAAVLLTGVLCLAPTSVAVPPTPIAINEPPARRMTEASSASEPTRELREGKMVAWMLLLMKEGRGAR